jgi:hypothetical protein
VKARHSLRTRPRALDDHGQVGHIQIYSGTVAPKQDLRIQAFPQIEKWGKKGFPLGCGNDPPVQPRPHTAYWSERTLRTSAAHPP